MKKNNIKYVLIPAFAAAALFPVLANDNQAKANEDKATTTSTVSNTENTNEKTTNVPTTNNVAKTTPTTPANIANSVKQTPTTNTESTNSASIVDNEIVKPKVPFTVTEYKQKSALELAQLIREKKVTSTELVDLAYKVIAEENPKLNAVLTTENGKIPHAIVEEAYRTAKEIDDRVKAGNLAAKPIDWKEQPFLGVPTLIKGLDELKNGDYTKGVYLNKGKIADKNGPVAAEFAKLGFVILGQTNTPELGTRNITDSKLFGPANNPWDLSRNTGGSSGGSAGAVASGMVPIASGSDAGGSIRIPSSWTGLIGLKPTGHVVKFPLVKTIEDAKAFFEKTELSKPKTLIEPPKDLKKLKIAYTLKTPLKDLELSEVAKKAILQTVDFLRKEGFTVEEVKEFPIDGYEGINTYTVGAIGEEGYVAAVKGVTEENKRQLDPATYALGTSSYMGPNANTDISSVKPLSTFINQMNEFYKKYDLFLVPTNAVTAPSNDKKVDPYVDPEVEEQLYNINKITDPKERFKLLTKQWLPMTRRSPYTWVFNLSGNPAISLPTYLSDKNLPFGVMFAAKDNSEKVLLEIGQYFQDRHQFKMNPAIRGTNVSENGNKVGINEDGNKFEYAVPTYAPSVAELPTLNINNETATIPSKSENSQTTSVKEEKKVVNTNKLNSNSRTLPNTGESTNNFLSAIGLSFLALIGLLKRKNNN